MTDTNEFGQPVGDLLDVSLPAQRPDRTPMQGRLCSIVPLDPAAHAEALHRANDTGDGRNWTYLPYGPFGTLQDYRTWLDDVAAKADPLFHTILDGAGQPVGIASYLRIDPQNGAIEVGHIHFSPLLQRTALSTEAMFLMMSRVFDELGYRRYEWKCNALNEPSCHAAKRLGFTYEGTFRQATHAKGRNRDTAWFAIIDKDWSRIRDGFRAWLDPSNFDADGQQKSSLSV